jgi:hypothetical protein
MFAIAHAGVETFGDDVDEGAVADDFEIDLRIRLEKRRHHRRHHQIDRRRRRVDTEPAGGHAAQAPHLIERAADIRDCRSDSGQQ